VEDYEPRIHQMRNQDVLLEERDEMPIEKEGEMGRKVEKALPSCLTPVGPVMTAAAAAESLPPFKDICLFFLSSFFFFLSSSFFFFSSNFEAFFSSNFEAFASSFSFSFSFFDSECDDDDVTEVGGGGANKLLELSPPDPEGGEMVPEFEGEEAGGAEEETLPGRG
jgi:hypothetical protein